MSSKIIRLPVAKSSEGMPIPYFFDSLQIDEKFINSGIWKTYLANGGSTDEFGKYCAAGLESGMKKAFVKRIGEELYRQYVLKSQK